MKQNSVSRTGRALIDGIAVALDYCMEFGDPTSFSPIEEFLKKSRDSLNDEAHERIKAKLQHVFRTTGVGYYLLLNSGVDNPLDYLGVKDEEYASVKVQKLEELMERKRGPTTKAVNFHLDELVAASKKYTFDASPHVKKVATQYVEYLKQKGIGYAKAKKILWEKSVDAVIKEIIEFGRKWNYNPVSEARAVAEALMENYTNKAIESKNREAQRGEFFVKMFMAHATQKLQMFGKDYGINPVPYINRVVQAK